MTDQPNDTSTQLKNAYALIRDGRKAEALTLLRPITQQDPNNVQAWWLVANALDDPAKIQKTLTHILRIEPDHEGAANKLAVMIATHPEAPSDLRDLTLPKKPQTAKAPRRAKRKKQGKTSLRLRLILLVLIFAGIGAAIFINREQGVQIAQAEPTATPAPTIPVTPVSTFDAPIRAPDFTDSAYFPEVNYDYTDESQPPCQAWTVIGHISNHKVGMIVRAFNENGVDVTVNVSNANGNYELHTTPQPNGAINVYLYDFAGSPPLSGLHNVRLETASAPTCGVMVNFRR